MIFMQFLLRKHSVFLGFLTFLSASVNAQNPGGVPSANMNLWITADSLVFSGGSAANDADAVDGWNDLSGNRVNDFADSNMAPPTYRSNAQDNINYHPIVEFDGINDGMNLGDDYIFTPAAKLGQTWFSVVKSDDHANAKTLQPIFDFGYLQTRGYGLIKTKNRSLIYTPAVLGGKPLEMTFTSDTLPELNRSIIDFGDSLAMFKNGDELSNSTNQTLVALTASQIDELPVPDLTDGPFTIGRISKTGLINNNLGRYLQGKFCELIGFDTLLTDTQIQKIETYLTLKYSLKYTKNYLASDSTIMYNTSTFNEFTIGIARDDSSNIFQKQSRDFYDTTRIYLGTLASDNASNTSTKADFTGDIRYLVMGSDGKIMASSTAAKNEKPSGIYSRIAREFKLKNTRFTGTFNLDFRLNKCADTSRVDKDHLRLLVDTDDDFSDATIYSSADGLTFSYADGVISIQGIANSIIGKDSLRYLTIGSTDYDTPLRFNSYPMNIGKNMNFWIHSQNGSTTASSASTDGDAVNGWNDLSCHRKNNLADSNMAPPTFRDNVAKNINYHPAIEFDGINDGLNLGDDYVFTEAAKLGQNWFCVFWPDSNASNRTAQLMLDFGRPQSHGYGIFAHQNYISMYSPESFGGATTFSDSGLHYRGSIPMLSNSGIDFQDSIFVKLEGTLFAQNNITLTKLTTNEIWENPINFGSSGPFTIGRQSVETAVNNNNGRRYQGRISEIIGFDTLLSSTETQKIETYLAIKYGIALQKNYISSSGTTIYDTAQGYRHYTIGIGRDDNSTNIDKVEKGAIFQKQSHDYLDSVRIYMNALATDNMSNTATRADFAGNERYVVMGSDGKAMCMKPSVVTDFPTATIYSRLAREFKVTNTDFSADFNIDFRLNECADTANVTTSHLRLLIDTDSNLTDATVYGTADGLSFAYNDGIVSVSNVSTTLIPTNSTRFLTLASTDELTPLPIELLSFAGYTSDNTHVLEWQTASEQDNCCFELQRSADAQTWTTLATIDGAINSNVVTNYSYIDSTVLNGSNYYRLKQIDFNGSFSFSDNIVHLLHQQEIDFSLHPNPASDFLTIELSTPYQNISYEIYNSAGQLVKKNHLNPLNGLTLQISIQELAKGDYFIKLTNGALQGTKEFAILKF